MKVKVNVAQSYPTLWDPMDYTVHGILQARILEWVAFLFSRGTSQPRDRIQVSHIAGAFFTRWGPREDQECWSGSLTPSPVNLPDPGIEPGSPALQVDSLPTELIGNPNSVHPSHYITLPLFLLPTGGHYVNWNESDRVRQILYDIIYIWYLKNTTD